MRDGPASASAVASHSCGIPDLSGYEQQVALLCAQQPRALQPWQLLLEQAARIYIKIRPR